MALNLFGRRRRGEPPEPRPAPDPDSTSERTPEEQALLERAREESARRATERRGEAEAVADLLGGMLSGPEPADAARGGAAAEIAAPREAPVRESSRSTDVFDAERLAAAHRGPPPEAGPVAAPAEPLVEREYSLEDLPGTDTVVLAPLPQDDAVPIDPNDTLLDGELIGADLLWDIDKLEDSAPAREAASRAPVSRPAPAGDDGGLDAALEAAAGSARPGPDAPAAGPAMQKSAATRPPAPPMPAEPRTAGLPYGAVRPSAAVPAPVAEPAARELSVRQLAAVERRIERDLKAEERRAAVQRPPPAPPEPGWAARARLAATRAVAAIRAVLRATDRKLAPYSLSCETLMGIAGLITLSVIGAMSLRIWVFPR